MQKAALALLGATALSAAALAGTASGAWAEGAIAVGTTGNVVRDGIAFGQVVDEPKEAAADTAIERCRTFQARAAAERCKLVVTFSRQCFAVAYDPEPGTPGAGWGVAPDQLDAMQKAIAMCEEAAGPARKGYCQVASTGCDTTGKEVSQTIMEEPAQTDAKPPQGAPPAPGPQRAAPPRPQGKERGAGSGAGGAPSPANAPAAALNVILGETARMHKGARRLRRRLN